MRFRSSQAEEGASATMFVISLLAFFAVAMLAIDGGFLYVSRRGQVADTDAGALAAANWMIENRCASSLSVAEANAEAEAAALVTTNDASTSIIDDGFDVEWLNSDTCRPAGIVTVVTERPPNSVFAPIFGYDDLTTGVETRVKFGQLSEAESVKPLGFCASDQHYQEFLNYLATDSWSLSGSHPDYSAIPGNPVVHRIEIDSVTTSSCSDGDGSGNWGWIDFDGVGSGGGAGFNQFRDRLLNGYGPGVSLGLGPGETTDPVADNDCDAATAAIENGCPGVQGAGGKNFNDELGPPPSGIRCTQATEDCDINFAVVYDQVTGNGNNVRYRLVGLVQFILRGASPGITGNPGPEDYLDIEFVEERVRGAVTTPDPQSAAPFGTNLCGTGTADNC